MARRTIDFAVTVVFAPVLPDLAFMRLPELIPLGAALPVGFEAMPDALLGEVHQVSIGELAGFLVRLFHHRGELIGRETRHLLHQLDQRVLIQLTLLGPSGTCTEGGEAGTKTSTSPHSSGE